MLLSLHRALHEHRQRKLLKLQAHGRRLAAARRVRQAHEAREALLFEAEVEAEVRAARPAADGRSRADGRQLPLMRRCGAS